MKKRVELIEPFELVTTGSIIGMKSNNKSVKVVGMDFSDNEVKLKIEGDANWHEIDFFFPIKITIDWLNKLGITECTFDGDKPEDEMYIGPVGGKFCLKDGSCYRCIETGWYEEIGTADSVHDLQYYLNIL